MTNELARAALSRLFEPQDAAAPGPGAGRGGAGRPADCQRRSSPPVPELEQEITGILADSGVRQRLVRAHRGAEALGAAHARPRTRSGTWPPCTGSADGIIIPSDELWPRQLADLGLQEPLCLWWRGVEQELPPAARSIALVGSRDSTSYGASVTGDLAYSLAQRGFTIVSGGAYGIDAHAHRAALAGSAGGVPTIAVMAGGVDRFYPVRQ